MGRPKRTREEIDYSKFYSVEDYERKTVNNKRDEDLGDDDDEYDESDFEDEVDEEIEESDKDEELDDVDEDDDDIKEKAKKKKKAEPKVKAAKEPKEPKEPKEVKKRGKKSDMTVTTKAEKKPKKEKVVKEKVKKEKKVIELLESTYDLNERYFYQDLHEEDVIKLKAHINNYFNGNENTEDIIEVLKKFPNLKKGEHNMEKLLQIIEHEASSLAVNTHTFNLYKQLITKIMKYFFMYRPTVLDCHFFPNKENEVHVVNMLRTCKKTLDIAIFTLTNNKISAAIEEAFKRGVKIRLIADDECCKMWGSDVFNLALLGVPVKTDNALKYHMHHKFAVLDNSVVVTGSFNWTSQAVNFNQENILFLESKDIAQKYTDEYNRLWNDFTTEISPEKAQIYLDEAALKKKEADEKRKQEKALKDLEKAKN